MDIFPSESSCTEMVLEKECSNMFATLSSAKLRYVEMVLFAVLNVCGCVCVF